jgi:hypothetical protein
MITTYKEAIQFLAKTDPQIFGCEDMLVQTKPNKLECWLLIDVKNNSPLLSLGYKDGEEAYLNCTQDNIDAALKLIDWELYIDRANNFEPRILKYNAYNHKPEICAKHLGNVIETSSKLEVARIAFLEIITFHYKGEKSHAVIPSSNS